MYFSVVSYHSDYWMFLLCVLFYPLLFCFLLFYSVFCFILISVFSCFIPVSSSYPRWTLEDDTILYDGAKAKIPLEVLCITLKRGYQGVKARLNHLNNPKHKAYQRFFGSEEGAFIFWIFIFFTFIHLQQYFRICYFSHFFWILLIVPF